MAEFTTEQRLRDFQYHQVDPSCSAQMAVLRAMYYRLAEELVLALPESRERSLALTHLEESSMRAIQCLAVHLGTPIPVGGVAT